VLRAALAPRGAFLRRRRLADAGEALAPELVAGEAGQIDIVLGVVARVGRAFDRRHNAPAPAEFHGADADQIHARLIDRAVALLDQRAGNAAPAQIAGEREPDRPAADHQNRYDVIVHVLRPDCAGSYAAAGRKSEACALLHRGSAGKLRPFSPEGRRTG